MTRFIFVTGGVVSSLGKGIAASSLGAVLEARGLSVTILKLDPYLNVDPGTMSPYQHGEVYVTQDGAETDLDLGHYERFLRSKMTHNNNFTSGQVYETILRRERRGDFLGGTVQVIPHVTDEIQNWIVDVANRTNDGKHADVCIIELGGTVGDIESAPYIEALRQFQFRVGRENILFVHVSLVPVMGPVGEQKTKPTQHTVKELRSLGINPDILICRSKEPLTDESKEKLAAFCHVRTEAVLSTHDVPNIYHVPLMLHEQGIEHILGISCSATSLLDDWAKMAHHVDGLTEVVKIAMVGKYTNLSD